MSFTYVFSNDTLIDLNIDTMNKGCHMKGTIVAVNHQLGAIVVESADQKCMVLETIGRLTAKVGDEIEADWSQLGRILVDNLSQNTQVQMMLQTVNVSRNEAIGRMTVL